MVTDDERPALVDIAEEAEQRLYRHLHHWLGAVPEGKKTVVTTSSAREHPGWDGILRPFVGVVTPASTVISVSEHYLEQVSRAVEVGGIEELKAQLPMITGDRDATLREGIFRYQQALAEHDERGEWIDPKDKIVPEWLRPFNGAVLVAFDEQRHYAAGVGRKRHDDYGQELAVVTEPSHRRMGYARDLIAQAAERVYAERAISTYLHRPDNIGSAMVAESTGFYDRGWKIISLQLPNSL
jgi:GNAT superfamily N-acetyltransferase